MDEKLSGGTPIDRNIQDETFRTELVRQRPALCERARRLSRNAADAGDLVQDTLVRALRAAHQFKPGTNLGAWLNCIMRNLFVERCRSRGRVRVLNPRELDSLSAHEARTITLADLVPQSAINAAIDGLRPFHRDIVRLAYFEQLTQRAIAERLHIPQSTAGVRLYRAKAKIRSALEAKWGWILPGQKALPAGAGGPCASANDTLADVTPVRRKRVARRAPQVATGPVPRARQAHMV
jgi:RNA polymerase sigma-70 factor, ECF subfamily